MRRPVGPPQVHKFGGASLADSAGIARVVSIIEAQRPAPLAIVVSALAGVTDALLEIAAHAVRGESDVVRANTAALHERHAKAARELLSDGSRRRDTLRVIDETFTELEQIAAGLAIVRELTPRTNDYLVARGERLSARLVSAALEEAGCPVALVDALEVIRCDSNFGNASPDLALTDRSARRVLGPLLKRGIVAVIPGFIAGTPDGQLATLGRGGSDLTATLLGRALGAREVSLWKDVPGMLTADPRMVPMRRDPAANLREPPSWRTTARRLHPRALIPLRAARRSQGRGT
jgi:aspartate kinase